MDCADQEFCKIFVTPAEIDMVKEKVVEVFGGSFEGKGLESQGVSLDVLRNPDRGQSDEFLGWPLVLEVERSDEISHQDYVALISRLVELIWSAGNSAVAACDFEEELPWNGGIGRL